MGSGAKNSLEQDRVKNALGIPEVVPPSGWKSDSDYQLPLQGAESLMQAGQRVARHVTCRMQAPAETAGMGVLKVFVGHGAAFRHAAHHMGILTRNDIARLSMFHAQPVFVEWDGDGIWRHVDGEWKVRNASDVAQVRRVRARTAAAAGVAAAAAAADARLLHRGAALDEDATPATHQAVP